MTATDEERVARSEYLRQSLKDAYQNMLSDGIGGAAFAAYTAAVIARTLDLADTNGSFGLHDVVAMELADQSVAVAKGEE